MIRALVMIALASRVALAEPALQVGAELRFGVTTAPFEATMLSVAKGHALVLSLDGAYEPAPWLVLGVHASVVLASVAQPAGAYIDTSTLGNPQLGAVVRWLDEAQLAVDSGLELGVPLASHSPTLLPNRALAIADGIAGMAAPELFTPGVVPVTAVADARWTSRPWTLSASVRVPLLLRFSDADLKSGVATPRSVGAASVIGVGARRQLTHRLAVAAATQLVIELAPSVDHVRARSRVQDLEQLALAIRLGQCAELAIQIEAAAGGELGGSTLALGVVRSAMRF